MYSRKIGEVVQGVSDGNPQFVQQFPRGSSPDPYRCIQARHYNYAPSEVIERRLTDLA